MSEEMDMLVHDIMLNSSVCFKKHHCMVSVGVVLLLGMLKLLSVFPLWVFNSTTFVLFTEKYFIKTVKNLRNTLNVHDLQMILCNNNTKPLSNIQKHKCATASPNMS